MTAAVPAPLAAAMLRAVAPLGHHTWRAACTPAYRRCTLRAGGGVAAYLVRTGPHTYVLRGAIA